MIYNIPITWESYMTIGVEADNLEDAIVLALKEFFSIPDDNYIDDSFQIDSMIDDDYPNEEFHFHNVYKKVFE